MTLYEETKIFFVYIILGLIFSLIFDIFRGYRRHKKVNVISIYIQDIVYFLIVGIILLITMIKILESEIRLYNFLGISLGIIIYVSIFGNAIRNIFSNLFKISGKILAFIILPLTVYNMLFKNQVNFLKKFVINCCKKISYVINFKCTKTKFVKQKKNSN